MTKRMSSASININQPDPFEVMTKSTVPIIPTIRLSKNADQAVSAGTATLVTFTSANSTIGGAIINLTGSSTIGHLSLPAGTYQASLHGLVQTSGIENIVFASITSSLTGTIPTGGYSNTSLFVPSGSFGQLAGGECTALIQLPYTGANRNLAFQVLPTSAATLMANETYAYVVKLQ